MGGRDGQASAVPHGWKAIRADFAHYRRVHRAASLSAAIALLFSARSFWALAVYRYGRWANARNRGLLGKPLRLAFGLAYQLVMRLTKVSIGPTAELGPAVWLASGETIIIAPGTKVSAGARFHGGNTLGVGGRAGVRGVPTLGEGVELCSGAVALGPVEIPAGARIGPNSVVSRTLPHGGLWVGTPVEAQGIEGATKMGENRLSAPVEHLFDGADGAHDPVRPEPFWENFRADLHRHFVYHQNLGTLRKLKIVATVDGIWAMAVYRFGRALRGRPVWGRLLRPAFLFAQWVLRLLTAISLDVESQIGPGFYIGHFGPIRVGAQVRIGKNCSIGQLCVVTGARGPTGFVGAPVLGDRVFLGVGSKVVGPVRVGDAAVVGANAVVLSDVPSSGVVVGAPAKLVSTKGSAEFIFLGHRQTDAVRTAAAEALARTAQAIPPPGAPR